MTKAQVSQLTFSAYLALSPLEKREALKAGYKPGPGSSEPVLAHVPTQDEVQMFDLAIAFEREGKIAEYLIQKNVGGEPRLFVTTGGRFVNLGYQSMRKDNRGAYTEGLVFKLQGRFVETEVKTIQEKDENGVVVDLEVVSPVLNGDGTYKFQEDVGSDKLDFNLGNGIDYSEPNSGSEPTLVVLCPDSQVVKVLNTYTNDKGEKKSIKVPDWNVAMKGLKPAIKHAYLSVVTSDNPEVAAIGAHFETLIKELPSGNQTTGTKDMVSDAAKKEIEAASNPMKNVPDED